LKAVEGDEGVGVEIGEVVVIEVELLEVCEGKEDGWWK
jgi:hypothetical protein